MTTSVKRGKPVTHSSPATSWGSQVGRAPSPPSETGQTPHHPRIPRCGGAFEPRSDHPPWRSVPQATLTVTCPGIQGGVTLCSQQGFPRERIGTPSAPAPLLHQGVNLSSLGVRICAEFSCEARARHLESRSAHHGTEARERIRAASVRAIKPAPITKPSAPRSEIAAAIAVLGTIRMRYA